jgi:hypothetical protein
MVEEALMGCGLMKDCGFGDSITDSEKDVVKTTSFYFCIFVWYNFE